MVIRKSKSKNALDPNHSFGLPLSQPFYEAACLLLEHIESRISKPMADKRNKDLLRVYAQSSLLPPLFLARHTIELKIKEVLLLTDIAHGIKKPKKRNMHNLQELWRELSVVAFADFADEFKENSVTLSTLLECVAFQIDELHAVDAPGTNFRYPEALEDNKLFAVDIGEVREQLDAMVDSLGELERAYTALIDHHNQSV